MHVHGAHLNPNAYAAVEAEKTAAAKRAAEARKKLLSGASEIESEAEVQAIPVTDESNEDDSPPGQNQQLPQISKKSDAEENDDAKNDAGEEDESADPISIWG